MAGGKRPAAGAPPAAPPAQTRKLEPVLSVFCWNLLGYEHLWKIMWDQCRVRLKPVKSWSPEMDSCEAPPLLVCNTVEEARGFGRVHARGRPFRAVQREWLVKCQRTLRGPSPYVADAAEFELRVTPAAAVAAAPAPAPALAPPPEPSTLVTLRRVLSLRYLAAPHHNAPLAAAFRELVRYEAAHAMSEVEEYVETQGFARPAALLRALPAPLTCAADLNAHNVPFFGADSRIAVDEFLSCGHIKRLEELRANADLAAVALFLKLPWVGHATARSLVTLGIRTLDELERAYEGGKLAAEKEEVQIVARHAVAMQRPMTQQESDELFRAVDAVCRKKLRIQVHLERSGGYARRVPGEAACDPGQDSSHHDVDVLIRYEDEELATPEQAQEALEAVLAELDERGLLLFQQQAGFRPPEVRVAERPRPSGALLLLRAEWNHVRKKTPVGAANMDQFQKAFTLLQLPGCPPRRVDLVLVPHSQWAFAQLGWIGSRQFERWIRLWAQTGKNMRLTNHGLIDQATGAVVTRTGERLALDDAAAMHRYATETETVVDPATGEAHQLPKHLFRNEAEIFAAIDVEYRPPHERCC